METCCDFCAYNEYNKAGMAVGCSTDKTSDKLLKNDSARTTFKDAIEEYDSIMQRKEGMVFSLTDNDRLALLKKKYSYIKDAYELLGMEQIRELKYHTSHIQRLLISISEKMDNNAKVAKLLLTIPAFRIGEFIPSADIKDCLNSIYGTQEINRSVFDKRYGSNDLDFNVELTGGDPINNQGTWDRVIYNGALLDKYIEFDYVDATGKSCLTGNIRDLDKITALKVTFKVDSELGGHVTAPYYTTDGRQYSGDNTKIALPLDNAFRVEIATRYDQYEVARMNFSFELQMPTNCPIKRESVANRTSAWSKDKDGNDVLKVYGEKLLTVMMLLQLICVMHSREFITTRMVLTMHKQMLKLTGMKYWFRLIRSKLLVRLMKAMQLLPVSQIAHYILNGIQSVSMAQPATWMHIL